MLQPMRYFCQVLIPLHTFSTANGSALKITDEGGIAERELFFMALTVRALLDLFKRWIAGHV